MAKASGSSPLESTIEMNRNKDASVWFLYVLECADGSFYTGISNNLQERIKEHNSGRGSKYARSRLPVKLIYSETYTTKSRALKREIEVKSLTRTQKEELVGRRS